MQDNNTPEKTLRLNIRIDIVRKELQETFKNPNLNSKKKKGFHASINSNLASTCSEQRRLPVSAHIARFLALNIIQYFS